MVGGEEDHLNPALIHLNEDGSTKYEICQTGKHEKRRHAVGELLDNKVVICGGYESDFVAMTTCEVIGQNSTQMFDMSANGRIFASSVKLNESTLWMTGGSNDYAFSLSSTEFVNINGSVPGMDLPFNVIRHCMIQFEENTILLIGGYQNELHGSDKFTWIIDLANGFQISQGPKLIYGRTSHSCGKIKDKLGNVLIVVAGGDSEESHNPTEILNTTTMETWNEGKNKY